MSKFISNIENLRIHDASAVHGIIPNDRNYSVQIGNIDSSFGKSVNVDLPNDVNMILNNLTTDLILRDSSDSDIECYNKSEIDSITDKYDASINTVENHVGKGEAFDPYKAYVKNQFVIYDNAYWKCIVDRFQGEWNPAGWEQTSLLREIEKLYGTETSVEKLTIYVSVNRGEGIVADTSIKVIYDAASGRQPDEVRLNSSGMAQFFIDYGDRYKIEYNGIPGYTIPESEVYMTGIPERVIKLICRQLGTGVFIIDENGIETDVALWNESRTDGRFVRFTNSVLNPGGSQPDNSIIISKNWLSQKVSKIWQIESKNLPSLPNINNASTAELDYNGWQNCQFAYNDCTIPNTAGKTFVDLYNESYGTSITIAEYLPAIYYAMNINETFMEKNVKAYLPSMGQLRQIYTNKDDINAALQKIGVSILSIESGSWWASSESGNTACRLYYGKTHFRINKNDINYAFPLFTL